MTETTVKTQEILDSVKRVPVLSPGASQLLDAIGKADYQVSDIVRIIETDPALTVSVLKTVNAAAMGLRREVDSIREALAFLGETKVVGIALAASAGEVFNADLAGYHGSRGDLGRHSLWTAIAARELSRHTGGRVERGVAFTAGLLHDIGKAVISDYLAEDLDRLASLREEIGDGDQLDLEHRTVGTDHADVGQALARHWNMPASLVAAIRYHHAPQEAPDAFRTMAYTVHTADMLAMMFGVGTGADDMQYTLDPDYRDHLDIDTGGLEGLALDVQVDFKATAEALFGDNQETEA
ncbi:HDOD domain-containing protein [bacterium]|nr:HDOD domain-containing protein [bacterium]